MKRVDKYPDTDTFKFYNANPKGLYTSDCVVRAISTVLNQSWEQTLIEMTQIGLKICRVFNDNKTIEVYMETKGWIKNKQPRKSNGKKVTGSEFCRCASANERYLCNIGGHHIVAVVNKRVHDTWDSTGGCIGNYWTKQV